MPRRVVSSLRVMTARPIPCALHFLWMFPDSGWAIPHPTKARDRGQQARQAEGDRCGPQALRCV